MPKASDGDAIGRKVGLNKHALQHSGTLLFSIPSINDVGYNAQCQLRERKAETGRGYLTGARPQTNRSRQSPDLRKLVRCIVAEAEVDMHLNAERQLRMLRKHFRSNG